MLHSGMSGVWLQGLKGLVQVGACSPSACWMSTMSYAQFWVALTWAAGNLEWIPLGWFLAILFQLPDKADVLYNSKCPVKECFVINYYFTVSHRKISTWKLLIFALPCVRPGFVVRPKKAFENVFLPLGNKNTKLSLQKNLKQKLETET